ncbi:MAG: bifunctional metallophosphatase/5'-nucleotidase [Eubacterium sp.]|jgi:5'-nucleotidase/UDP-sugar diphosphatase
MKDNQDMRSSAAKCTFLFTHDMHSHIEKFPEIKSIYDSEKSKLPQTFLIDAGDFSIGTPYQTIFSTDAAELRMMGSVGWDVTTIGNHEFDYHSIGASRMFEAAVSSGDKLPELVCSNIDFDATIADPATREDGLKLREALKKYGARDHVVIERGGVRVAFFGIFGKESEYFSPECGTKFKDRIQSAQDMVDEIKGNEDADMIVCLSHSGTNKLDSRKSEDEILAESVEGIDLIVSGHTHTYLERPIVKNGVVIASCGQYNDYIGRAVFSFENGRPKLEEYSLIPLDGTHGADEAVSDRAEQFKKIVDEKYFSRFGYSWDTVLAENGIEFKSMDEFGHRQGEDPLGSLLADSLIYGTRLAEGDSYEPVAVSCVPAGIVRASFAKGKVTCADAFNALSIGAGPDGLAGYPLVSAYLTGEELKLVAEIDISISPRMHEVNLYMSGLSYKYNPNRVLLNRAYDIRLETAPGVREEIDDKKLYRVVGDFYTTMMLGMVKSLSHGILSIVPKDKDGNKIENFEDHIIYDKEGREMKAWYALARYIDSFKGDEIPDYYGSTAGRKVEDNSKSLKAVIKSPNKYFFIITGGILVTGMLIGGIGTLAVMHAKKRRKKRCDKL